MTLKEIAVEYRKSGDLLRNRIRQLQAELASTEDPISRSRLERRINALRPMLRDVRDLAAFCEHYHDRSYHNNEQYKI